MPNRHITDANNYRYAYQGQEKDPETGKEAFELRLWDSRIGRWLSPDPMGQYFSPYMGMDNRPHMSIDPTGGCTVGVDCPEEFNWMGEGTWVADEIFLNSSYASVAGMPTPYGSASLTGGGSIDFSTQSDNYWSNMNWDSYYFPISFNAGTISEWKPNMAYEWSQSNNILKKFSYDTANGFYTTGQFFMLRSVGDNSMRNLNGTTTTSREGLDGFIGVATWGYGKSVSGLKYAKPIVSNGSMWNIFQKSTKGVFSSRKAVGYAYRIQIKNSNQMIIKHNIGVEAAKQGSTSLDYIDYTKAVKDYLSD